MTVLMRHDRGCPKIGQGHSDAAKRIYDTYHLHRSVDLYNAIGKWFAAALNDGSTDGVLYDSKRDAVIHQHHNEQFYTFLQITPANITICNAEVMLTVARRMYDAGLNLTDPDHVHGGPDHIKRTSIEDMKALVHGKATNLVMPDE